MTTENTALTMYDKISDPIAAIAKMGEWISKSGLFSCDKIEQGMVLAMTAYAERRPVTDICRRYHIMDGKLSMKSEAMLAEFNERGGVHFWEKTDDKEAVLLLTKGLFKDFRVVYTIKDAELADLCGKDGAMRAGQRNPGNWQHRPANMLRARAVSNGVGMVDPSVRVGVPTPEELYDMKHETITEAPQRSLLGANPPTVVDTPANSEVVEAEKTVPQDETAVDKLSVALEGITSSASEWLVDKGWVKAGQTFRDLPDVKVNEILGRLTNFKQVVKAWKRIKEEKANAKT